VTPKGAVAKAVQQSWLLVFLCC